MTQKLYYFIYETPFAPFYVFSTESALIFASFKNEVERDFFKGAVLNENLPVLQAAKAWLDKYFDGVDQEFTLPHVTNGTAFQATVWANLKTLRLGELVTYGNLSNIVAKELGRSRMSAQAVGTAVGQNPLSIFIPCHRIVAAGNKLGGYGGGLSNKKALLIHEGYNISEDKYYE
ncbi:MAG TPA: methylated-DNA--[protein]-cysteine S-methyltransferase [Bacilli bacterium]|nr:methylated-DNA--[protein]-cysteine S-methyltransferase [Bacilli bacterium]